MTFSTGVYMLAMSNTINRLVSITSSNAHRF